MNVDEKFRKKKNDAENSTISAKVMDLEKWMRFFFFCSGITHSWGYYWECAWIFHTPKPFRLVFVTCIWCTHYLFSMWAQPECMQSNPRQSATSSQYRRCYRISTLDSTVIYIWCFFPDAQSNGLSTMRWTMMQLQSKLENTRRNNIKSIKICSDFFSGWFWIFEKIWNLLRRVDIPTNCNRWRPIQWSISIECEFGHRL